MIDIIGDNLISFRDVPSLLPRRPNGKKLHLSVIYRWAKKGIKGTTLEFTKVGGTMYTSTRALQKFSEQLATSSNHTNTCLPQLARTRQAEINRAATAVRKELTLD